MLNEEIEKMMLSKYKLVYSKIINQFNIFVH